MGKRYYCDYCDRSFKDDIDSRKKHVSGSMHSRLKKEHYNSFRDPKTILEEESSKIPCKRFLQMGECVFGGNCRFSHCSPAYLKDLQHQLEEDERQKFEQMQAAQPVLPSGHESGSSLMQGKTINESRLLSSIMASWQLPATLRGYTNLPPSLQPIHFPQSEVVFEKWG